MTTNPDAASAPAATLPTTPRWRRGLRGILVLLLGCVVMAAPLFAGPLAFTLAGGLLVVCGVLEMLEAFHAHSDRLRTAYLSGEVSILAGILLLTVPEFVLGGVAVVLAVSFALDGGGKLITALRARLAGTAWAWTLAAGLVNVALAVVLATGWPISDWPVICIVVGVRMLMSGWSIILGRHGQASVVVTPVDQNPDVALGLPAHKEFAVLNSALDADEATRRPIDTFWCWIFVILFFAIHIGRMRVYWNLVGLVAPLVAVLGDLAVALAFAFILVLPVRLGWRKLTRPLERRAWQRLLGQVDRGDAPGPLGRLSGVWLRARLRFARRVATMRHSPHAALRWGMRVGLPLAAVFIAIQPIWGFSWFFNSESWATIVWDRWAAARTDTWRENMIAALQEHYRDDGIPADQLFRVEPPGTSGSDDFSFLVLGDTGEGGAAQHSLRDQLVLLNQRPDMKFLVVSSDVIYPDGAMRDYEPNFYLPFKGFTKPIYAIPGNHDWYDALEGFAANFLKPDAARTCMVSRLESDLRLTTTTERRIDGYIDEAARLRKEFGVQTGLQRGPFFDVQTERFALIAVDTGVLKTVDSAQWTWLKAALEKARGKFKMVILGHPLYTAGHYQGDPTQLTGEWTAPTRSPLTTGAEVEPFTAIHRLLREHEVELVMAGDMHFFEHYRETYTDKGARRTMHHFVNGGGGAYICVGMPFDWPRKPDVPVWTFFPRIDTITAKLDVQTPAWKMPLWLWVKHLSGWPFNGYIMSAAFDHNTAPFFQSFVEVQVHNSKDEVHLVPHGANGRLRWRELENFEALMPDGARPEDNVEFTIKMPPR